ncbi:MAG: hypothetical protein MJ016_02520, partial [Victivallaceae bacterium]|nr:hypothetical protein [Victivallaceae bacterium]
PSHPFRFWDEPDKINTAPAHRAPGPAKREHAKPPGAPSQAPAPTPAALPAKVVPPADKTVVVRSRDEMLRIARELTGRAKKGDAADALLADFDAFCRTYGKTRTPKEERALRDVIDALAPIDEKQRFAEARNQQRASFDRRSGEVRALRKAEAQRAEAEKRRRDEELRMRRLAERAARERSVAEVEKFKSALMENAGMLWNEFLRCAAANEAQAFARAAKQEIIAPSGAGTEEAVKLLADFEEYRAALTAILPEYTAFLAGVKNLENLRISVSLPGHGIAQILSVAPDRQATFCAANGADFVFALDETHRRETIRFLTTLGRTLKMSDGSGNRAIFYYALYTGTPTPAALAAAPGGFWTKYAAKWKLVFPKR